MMNIPITECSSARRNIFAVALELFAVINVKQSEDLEDIKIYANTTNQSHKTGLRSALHPGNVPMPV
jgi:hypothetical protein